MLACWLRDCVKTKNKYNKMIFDMILKRYHIYKKSHKKSKKISNKIFGKMNTNYYLRAS